MKIKDKLLSRDMLIAIQTMAHKTPTIKKLTTVQQLEAARKNLTTIQNTIANTKDLERLQTLRNRETIQRATIQSCLKKINQEVQAIAVSLASV